MLRRENTFRVDYSQLPKHLSFDEIHSFIRKELGLTREKVLQLQPSKRLGCTFVKVNNLETAENIVKQHDNKHEFIFDGKAHKLRITMEDGAVEVHIFDLSEDVSNEQVAAFLANYGDVLNIRDLLWDERYEFGGVKTGVRVARMIINTNIPSLVTIEGVETAVGYKGQRQTCLHCKEFVHTGIPCVQNKKLLVQKLVADQSYANVTKQTTLQSKTKPKKPTPKPSDTQKPDKIESNQQKTTMPPPTMPLPDQHKTKQAVVSILPYTVPTVPTNTNPLHGRSDGNETDSSQTSQMSQNNRRSRRQPPNKKVRRIEEDNTTQHTTEPEQNRVSDEELQE